MIPKKSTKTSITNERCFITACNTSFYGEGDGAGEGKGEGDGAGEGEAEGECGTTCCESIALLGCGDITCLPLGAFVALSFFQFLQLPFSLKIGRSLGRSSTISGVLQQLHSLPYEYQQRS